MARAFHDDPVWSWVFPDDARRRRLTPVLFAAALRFEALRGHALTSDDGTGVAIWVPPFAPRPSSLLPLRAGLPFAQLRLGGAERQRLRRYLELSVALYRRHFFPRWYLSGVAVDPVCQRRGIGSALVDWGLRHDGPFGLMTSSPANLAFYERRGFSVASLHDEPGGPPRTWLMVRG